MPAGSLAVIREVPASMVQVGDVHRSRIQEREALSGPYSAHQCRPQCGMNTSHSGRTFTRNREVPPMTGPKGISAASGLPRRLSARRSTTCSRTGSVVLISSMHARACMRIDGLCSSSWVGWSWCSSVSGVDCGWLTDAEISVFPILGRFALLMQKAGSDLNLRTSMPS